MQAFLFPLSMGLALTFLANPRMAVEIPIKLVKGKCNTFDYYAKSFDYLSSNTSPSNFKYHDLKLFYVVL